jgi:hypothetical protein
MASLNCSTMSGRSRAGTVRPARALRGTVRSGWTAASVADARSATAGSGRSGSVETRAVASIISSTPRTASL